jgi:hypothetical protein
MLPLSISTLVKMFKQLEYKINAKNMVRFGIIFINKKIIFLKILVKFINHISSIPEFEVDFKVRISNYIFEKDF